MARWRWMTAMAVAWLCALGAAAAASNGGGPILAPTDRASLDITRIHPRMVREAARLGLPLIASDAPEAAAAVGQLQYPLRPTKTDRGLSGLAVSNHVDLDNSSGIRDFACGDRTYDGHGGTDIFLFPYAWNAMDRKEVAVVAALGGVILEKRDGEFDRQCKWQGRPPANYVILRHDNGLIGYYWHLKKGSVTGKATGSRVDTGEFLGYVGSSGFSTGPHLHFEIIGSDGRSIEPARGACNSRTTSWSHQPATVDTALAEIATFSDEPASAGQCADETPVYNNRFKPGDTIAVAVYLRDQAAGKAATVEVRDPTGAVVERWSSGSPSSGFWTAAWWWWSSRLPADARKGIWRIRVVLDGKSAEHAFTVTMPGTTAVVTGSIANPVRTVSANAAATFTVTLRNSAAAAAFGCRLVLDRPIRATVTAKPVTGTFLPNQAFSIPARGAIKVRLTVKPSASFAAAKATFPVRVSCTNATPVPLSGKAGTLVLTSR